MVFLSDPIPVINLFFLFCLNPNILSFKSFWEKDYSVEGCSCNVLWRYFSDWQAFIRSLLILFSESLYAHLGPIPSNSKGCVWLESSWGAMLTNWWVCEGKEFLSVMVMNPCCSTDMVWDCLSAFWGWVYGASDSSKLLELWEFLFDIKFLDLFTT